MSSVFTSYAITAEELKNEPSLDLISEISTTEETLINKERTSDTIAENIYITPGTIIYGAENINSSAINFNSESATTKKKPFDENNILGISKDLVQKKKSKDLVLKHNQEKSLKKAKHTFFLSLSNSQLPCSSIVAISTPKSTSSKFSFDKLLITKKQNTSLHFSKTTIEEFRHYFVYFENEKISKSLLRGPPTI